jgi:hypothetical protein
MMIIIWIRIVGKKKTPCFPLSSAVLQAVDLTERRWSPGEVEIFCAYVVPQGKRERGRVRWLELDSILPCILIYHDISSYVIRMHPRRIER